MTVDDLTKALHDAAASLETIASLAGRKSYGNPPIETFMETFVDVRLYAAARAKVVREALDASTDQITLPLADAQMLLAWMDETFGNDSGTDWNDEDAAAVGDALNKAIDNFKRMRAACGVQEPAPTSKLPCVLGYATMCPACEAEGECTAALTKATGDARDELSRMANLDEARKRDAMWREADPIQRCFVCDDTRESPRDAGIACPNCPNEVDRDGAELAELREATRMTPDHLALAKFYGVTTYAALVQQQAHHIKKLQAKLSPTPSLAPQRVRDATQQRGMHALRDVIHCLRETGSYVDEEGEATNALEDLLDRIYLRDLQAGPRIPSTPPVVPSRGGEQR